ncbi:putative alpha-galactosidase [Beutenbergia cavernae DSM 12333]|uniref:Alpha-galactosidase n=1 Tax=Beutenbergia cavernae (strain ATCC BAA-8 / DSM 12333 / CCUG 43141 / JCM 11478 / NBRC 16432 / NCIMB 13614 / HKI 0122) TaxID=471853 RepID=C5BUU5_BEUC1|nr:glycoside hydrolase family 27 protein [Beutenbergia cavernae]ACQ78319.1 putative alpha-galactosidase [Beutenbergia cavernae DSM 12333]
MGWNSWDCYGTTVTEAEVVANAEFMATHLRAHGWDTVVVDIAWYDPTAKAHGYNDDAPLELDAHGRQLPAPNRFPSAADGAGFGPLAAKVHELGLRFGLHVMRGIPRLAVDRDLPIAGTGWTARDAADTSSICPWNPDNYGLDHTHPAAQAYYDAQVAQFAAWGVDFVKADDMLWPYHHAEIEAYARAIERSGRPMELSLSPGRDISLAHLDHLRASSAMWRVSDDLWDRWDDVEAQFARMARWAPHQSPEGWADADMLPLGRIGIRAERGDDRHSRLTPAEQVTLLSLWVISRSPLMMGGDLPTSSPETIALLTNDAVLDVLRTSRASREVLREGDLVLWTAEGADDGGTRLVPSGAPVRYAAVFHLGDEPTRVRLALGDVGGLPTDAVVDVWSGEQVPTVAGALELDLPAHGAHLLRLSPRS